jgi:xanthine dehydrogenase YagS FAD-binding subunit
MKKVTHVNAATLNEAATALNSGNAAIFAGGTDLLDIFKGYVLPELPDELVNIKTIPSLEYIKEEGGMLKIGAATRLADIAKSSIVQANYAALSEAAHKVASPEIRNLGTLGGNICQYNRCWYFRAEHNGFDCIRKGGNMCYAVVGDNRYHSIFGAINACFAVNPSDTAPALVALNARIVTNKQTIDAENFWGYAVPGSTVLAADEIVTEIQIPTPASGVKSAFRKFALRKSIDFPIVNCAAMIGAGDARICLNAVYNTPYRATGAENAIKGQPINDANATTAGTAAVASAQALPMNAYKIQIAKTLVKRTILDCA